MSMLSRTFLPGALIVLLTAGEVAADLPRLVTTLGTTEGVTAVAFSPDGRRVVTGGRKGETILWDVATGGEIRRLVGHQDAVVYAWFFAQGQRIVTGSADGTARIWNAATGGELHHFEAHMDLGGNPDRPEPEGRPFALSADERWIVTWHALGTLRVWDSATGTLTRELSLPGGPPHFLDVSPENRHLLAVGAFGTRLLSFATGDRLWEVREDRGAASFAPGDGRTVATSRSGVIVLRDIASGRELASFEEQDAGLAALSWSADGARLLSADFLGGVRLWEAGSGRVLAKLQHAPRDPDAAFDPAGGRFVVGDSLGNAIVYEAEGQRVARRLQSTIAQIHWLGFSGGRPQILAGDRRGTGYLWDPAGHNGVVRFSGHAGAISAAALSPDGKRVLTGGRDLTASLWDAASGTELRRFEWHEQLIGTAAFGDRGALALVSGGPLSFWDSEKGTRRDLRPGRLSFGKIDLSPDGKRVAAREILPTRVEVFDTETGNRLWSRKLDVTALRFSPDGGVLLVTLGLPASKALLLQTADGETVGEVPLPPFQDAHWAEFSADGRWIITAHDDRVARILRRGGGLHRELPHTHAVDRAALSADGRWALTSAQGIVHLWDVKGDGDKAKLLCRLILFTDGSWLVADPEGRFDASELDEARGVFWQSDGDPDPFRLLPPEVFLREYYEPQLLQRLLAGETFVPVRALETLDQAQPEIEFARIAPSPGRPDAVDVTVRVRATGPTGAADVYLLRDGRLFDIRPREGGRLALDAHGKADVTFPGVSLPHSGFPGEVVFSAYAFNGDGVKSQTVRAAHPLPGGLPARPGRAYLLMVGVNTFADSNWNLRYAANDARLLREVLDDGLRRTDVFEEVVAVPLIADGDNCRPEAEGLPDRAVIRAAIDLLAGRTVAPEIVSRIPAADRIRPAGPDDLVVLAFATHGVADPGGKFHLAPRDLGPGTLESWISSDDLSEWLRDVDAGSLVMIVDACHSAATIAAPGFKPGPLGSRGLGQLAYDKGMQILAASGVDSVALESGALQQGFLTYALARSGLAAFRADWHPRDGAVSVSEWLAFGVRRVPEVHEEVRRGEVPADEADRKIKIFGGGPPQGRWVQEPVVFDFARGGRNPLILASPPRARAGLAARLHLAEGDEKTELDAITALPAGPERLTRLYRFLDALPGGEAEAQARQRLVGDLLQLRGDAREIVAATRAAVSHLRGPAEELNIRIRLLRDVATALLEREERLDDAGDFARQALSLASDETDPENRHALERLLDRLQQERQQPSQENVP